MEFIAILRKYKFTLAYEEAGCIVYRCHLSQPPSRDFHEVKCWPTGTWEITHYKFGRCYYASFKDAEALDAFLYTRFPELRG